ncbi:MAG: hypothetical protein F6K28_53625 [Microcoleus sp. SIO2G3]|nr:hypothetical protein [Microcoleus sp. SIO2G3]
MLKVYTCKALRFSDHSSIYTMKFFTIFLLTVIILGFRLPSFGQSGIIQGQLVISSSDERSFVPARATNPYVMIDYLEGDLGGATSIRFEKNKKLEDNKYPSDSKTVFGNRTLYGETYQQRDRDLGQTFLTDDKGFTVDAVYLRVGPNEV